eukprot:11195314-Lingulodinium_polyedra.AAC.1
MPRGVAIDVWPKNYMAGMCCRQRDVGATVFLSGPRAPAFNTARGGVAIRSQVWANSFGRGAIGWRAS